MDSSLSFVTLHTGSTTLYPTRDCINFDSDGCDPGALQATASKGMVTAKVIYPLCSSEISESCVDGATITSPSSSEQLTTFAYYSNPEFQLQPLPKLGLPFGSSIPVFKNTVLDGSRPDQYFAVRIVADYRLTKNKFEFQKMTSIVTPISIEASNSCQPSWHTSTEGSIGPGWPATYRLHSCGGQGVLFQNGFSKSSFENFEEGTRVQLKLRIPKTTGKWFFGQFGDVRASQVEASSVSDLVTIDAEAAKVPQFEARIPRADIKPGFYLGSWDLYKDMQNYPGGRQMLPDANSESMFEILDQLRSFAKDSAVDENLVWNFRSGTSWGGVTCGDSVKGITGIVATNAMAYSGFQPSYSNGYFDFKVAGMHFNSDGTEARGSYDLLLRSEFARCLYGFSNAPVSGTVSVTTADGQPSVATTIVSESDGFIRLAAKNFGFSEKQIKVKLAQKQQIITCQKIVNKKVKETRVVKGKVCPKGFTKKK